MVLWIIEYLRSYVLYLKTGETIVVVFRECVFLVLEYLQADSFD